MHFLLQNPAFQSIVLFLASFVLQQQSVVATEAVWPTKLNVFIL